MDKIKAKGYINIAHKAGYIIIGSDKLKSYSQKLYLILLDKTAASNSRKIANRFSETGIEVVEVEDLESLSNIRACKIIGVKNKELSINIKNNLIN